MGSINDYEIIREAYLSNGKNKIPVIKMCAERYHLPLTEAKKIIDKIADEVYYAEAEEEKKNPPPDVQKIFHFSFSRYIKTFWLLIPMFFLCLAVAMLFNNPETNRIISLFFESAGIHVLVYGLIGSVCIITAVTIPFYIFAQLVAYYPKTQLHLDTCVLLIEPYTNRRTRSRKKRRRKRHGQRDIDRKRGKSKIDYVTSFKVKSYKIVVYGYEDYYSTYGKPIKAKINIHKVYENQEDLLKRLCAMTHHE